MNILEITVYAYDGVAKSYTPDQLGEVLIPANDITVLSCDENGYVFQTEGNDPQFTVSPQAMKDIHKSFLKNNIIALFALYMMLAAFVMYFFGDRIKAIYFADKKKVVATLVQILYFAFFLWMAKEAYSGQFGFWLQTALWMGLVLLAMTARLIWCPSTKSKPVATCVAVSVLAEIVYGSSLGGKIFEPFAPDLVLYVISICCAFIFLCYCLWNGKDTSAFLWIFATILMFQYIACTFSYDYTLVKTLRKTFHFWSQYQCLLTGLALVGFFLVLRGILGKGIALVLYTIVYMVFQVGNLIEMIYHGSVFKPLDFLAFAEAADVAKNYLNPVTITGFILVILMLGCCLWKFRKQVADFLRPSRSGASLVFGAMLLMWIFSGLYYNIYYQWEIYSQYTWGPEYSRLKKQGYVPYFYYYCLRTKAVFSDEPENYSEESVRTVLAPYMAKNNTDGDESMQSQVKPDVIFVMLESIFDVDALEQYGVTYSEDPNPTLDQYQIATTLTSVRGGLTAKSEFEALMGLSGSFYMNGIVEYLTFWGSSATERYSLVREFEKNGYSSCAIHQNTPSFYNRANAYEGMGFDKFVSADTYGNDFAPEDKNEDQYLTNVHFMKLLKQELETDEGAPKFIWGITIESHTPYGDKYKEADIEVKCDKISDGARKDLTNYIQSVKKTDEFFEELIAYVNEREKPTVVVMFGDHRPSLEAMEVIGANGSNLEAYATACYAYSNFSEIEKPAEYISLNYLPALVLDYAGIEKNAFYNYLYELQKKHPVVSNIFPDEGFEAEKENYKLLQYDIMFGEGYCREF